MGHAVADVVDALECGDDLFVMSLDQAALTFREEALELLGEVEETLLTLEDHPEDTEQIAKLFRAMNCN